VTKFNYQYCQPQLHPIVTKWHN